MSRWKVERWADPNVAAWVAREEDAPDRMMLFPTHAEALDYADRQARTRPVVLWPTAAPLALEDDTRAQLCAEYIGSGETLRWVNIYNRFAGTQQPIDVLDCLPLARWLLKVHYTLMQEGVIPATD